MKRLTSLPILGSQRSKETGRSTRITTNGCEVNNAGWKCQRIHITSRRLQWENLENHGSSGCCGLAISNCSPRPKRVETIDMQSKNQEHLLRPRLRKKSFKLLIYWPCRYTAWQCNKILLCWTTVILNPLKKPYASGRSNSRSPKRNIDRTGEKDDE